jgi:glucose/arabinose dehydrogenase
VGALLLASCASGTDQDTQNSTSTPVVTTAPNAEVSYEVREIGSLPGAVDIVERDANDDFVYVVSRFGTVERWGRDGDLVDEVLDIDAYTTGEGERGLLGLTFRERDGAWTAFVNYTNLDDDTVIASYPVRADGTFDTSTPQGTAVIAIDQPYKNHNGGGVVVGPDGYLYIGMGDGGSANDPERYALNTSSLLGKMLRIDPRTDGGYDIPADNPYVGVADAREEIWSIGLRNPWRFSFDPQGNLWVADVGQGNIEEVSVASAGEQTTGGRGVSFGWSAYEGSQRFNQDVVSDNALAPVHEYTHDNGACSISGGAIGTNAATPSRAGWYFFSDYCSGKVSAILTDGTRTVMEETVTTGLSEVTAVRTTSTSLYVLSLSGPVYEIRVVRQ